MTLDGKDVTVENHCTSTGTGRTAIRPARPRHWGVAEELARPGLCQGSVRKSSEVKGFLPARHRGRADHGRPGESIDPKRFVACADHANGFALHWVELG